MKILGITRRVGQSQEADDARAALLLPEIHAAWHLHMADFIREFYLAPERQAVVVIIEAESIAAAQEMLKTLPMVRDGLVEFELSSLLPYKSFALLFRPEFGP